MQVTEGLFQESWVWIEAEDYRGETGGIVTLRDWGAAAMYYVELHAAGTVSYLVSEPSGLQYLSLRYRNTSGSLVNLEVTTGGSRQTALLEPTGPKEWRWVTLQIETKEYTPLEIQAGFAACHLDGFFLHCQPMELPAEVGLLNEIAGRQEALASTEGPNLNLEPVELQSEKPERFVSDLVCAAAEDSGSTRVLKSLAGKPCPYILHTYDTGEPTDYDADFVWHCLVKEKLWNLPCSGMPGVVNPNSDIAWVFGFQAHTPESPQPGYQFRPALTHKVHLANLLTYSLDIHPDLQTEITITCHNSNTLRAVVQVRNTGSQPVEFSCVHGITKNPCTNPPVQTYTLPGQKFGAGVEVLTGTVEARGVSVGGQLAAAVFYEWIRKRSRGRRLAATLAGEGTVHASQAEALAETPFIISACSGDTILPLQTRQFQFALNLRRFTTGDTWGPELAPRLYNPETQEEALAGGLNSCREALQQPWKPFIDQSVQPYRSYPLVTVPEPTWEADFYACLEMIRASTFSPRGNLETPYYNFCRIHAHEPLDWWSYGMHAHESLIILFQNYVDPQLSQDFLMGHIAHQCEDGKYPYGVSHTISVRTMTEEATLPVLIWECWLAYLWSGDREFLQTAYISGKKNLDWYLSTRDRMGEGLCHYLNYSWETSRDDNGLPTWMTTGGAMYQEALDLNCYLVVQRQTLALMAQELGLPEEAHKYRLMAMDVAKKMNAWMWHTKDKCYYGIGEVVPSWANVKDISTFYPLWAGIVPPGRFQSLVELYTDPETFGTPFGPPTLARNEPCFNPEGHWFGSNWLEMSLFPLLGLKRYGCLNLMSSLANQNIKMVFDELDRFGHFREYFNSVEGNGTDLIDYNWTGIVAYFLIAFLFGIEPNEKGLEIKPALPDGWDRAEITGLCIRGKKVSVYIQREPTASDTAVIVNSHSEDPLEGRGVLIPWEELVDGTRVEIQQPMHIQDTPVSPPEAPRDWSDVPPHEYPDDPHLIAEVKQAMVAKQDTGG